jgi:hypothetical protein
LENEKQIENVLNNNKSCEKKIVVWCFWKYFRKHYFKFLSCKLFSVLLTKILLNSNLEHFIFRKNKMCFRNHVYWLLFITSSWMFYDFLNSETNFLNKCTQKKSRTPLCWFFENIHLSDAELILCLRKIKCSKLLFKNIFVNNIKNICKTKL